VDPLVAQLARACPMHRTRAKWVFRLIPELGCAQGDRLVLERTAWASLFVTVLSIPLPICAPVLVDLAINGSGEGPADTLAIRLPLDLPEVGESYRPSTDSPTTVWTGQCS
jgi:hypothetical protein